MKKRNNILVALLLIAMSLACLSGCGGTPAKKDYIKYVESYLDSNYKGQVDSYAKLTGVDKASVSEAFDDGMSELASAICGYYGMKIPGEDTELKNRLVDVTKRIYQKADYQVKEAKVDDDSATVEVIIKPMNILNDSGDSVLALIASFEQRKNNGEFDDYGTAKYESEFSSGVLDILEGMIDSMTYKDQVSVTVSVVKSGETYSISGEDLKKLDEALMATTN